MKAICLCEHGNSRSVVCSYILKEKYGVDSLSCGFRTNSKETLEMLFEWADIIILMQADFIRVVPIKYHHKVHVIDVGPDRWFVLHIVTDLIAKIDDSLTKLFEKRQ